MDKEFWKRKNVLITGFEGFLGSNLTRKLISDNISIIGLDIKVGRKNTLLKKNDYKRITVIKGSVTNYKLLVEILSKYKIEIVFHLAAKATVGECFNSPLCAFDSNIAGTWKLLEACRKYQAIRAVVCASSDKAYGSHKKLPYKEDAPLFGEHPYDVSKSCADLIAHSFYHSYNLPVAITRCGNIFGPGDFNFSRIIPEAIRCAILDKKLLIRSNGRFRRDYIYVEDIVEGYIRLAEQLERKNLAGEAFNFSNRDPIRVLELIKKIYRLLDKEPNYKILNLAKHEIIDQYLESKKATNILGWRPRYALNEALKKTVAWYCKIYND